MIGKNLEEELDELEARCTRQPKTVHGAKSKASGLNRQAVAVLHELLICPKDKDTASTEEVQRALALLSRAENLVAAAAYENLSRSIHRKRMEILKHFAHRFNHD